MDVSSAHGSAVSNVQAVATITYPDGTSETVPFASTGVTGDFIASASGVYKFPESTPPAPAASVSVAISGSFVEGHKTITFNKAYEVPVSVADAPLTPYSPPGASTSFTGNSGVPLIVTMYFLDASTLAQASEYTGTVNWGDGSTPSPLTNSNFVVRGQVNGQTEVAVTCTHAYQGGPFPITITVNDVGGQSVVLNGTANTVALQMLGLPNAVLAGQPIDFKGPDPPAMAILMAGPGMTPSDFSNSYINWGDGTPPSPAYITDEFPGNILPTGNSFDVGFVKPLGTGHIYQSAGTYTVTLYIVGPNGSVVAQGTHTEIINN